MGYRPSRIQSLLAIARKTLAISFIFGAVGNHFVCVAYERSLENYAKQSEDKCRPRHVHIATGSIPGTSMTISFATPFECGYPLDVMVSYKEKTDSGEHLNPLMARGESVETRQYNITQPDKQTYISDYFHLVVLTGLHSSTTYLYKCAVVVPLPEHSLTPVEHLLFDDETSQWSLSFDSLRLRHRQLKSHFYHLSSKEFKFTTTRLPSEVKPVKLALVGDLGQTIYSSHTVQHMKQLLPSISAILHAGDLSYADCDHSRWDTWFDMIEPLSSNVPWHVCPGNHELEIEQTTGRVYTSYRSRFKMPSVASEVIGPVDENNPARRNMKTCTPSVLLTEYDYGNSFHSTTFGQVHVLFLNSYTSSMPESRQYQWVQSELNRIDRRKLPWLVVVMHCPFYNTFAGHQREKQEELMKEHLEPLFVKYKVNIVVAGHTHAYSRSKPVAYNTVALNGKAPTYIVIGDGGNREGHDRFRSHDAEDWVYVRDVTTFGFGLLNVRNETHAKWQWIKNIDELKVDVQDEGYILNQFFL